ncbi:MAG: tetratricopeptide repeat protein [Scytonematopsis contorta HA4267-MV1]|jgi:tetratricopeptide (TPR) repeat protein|nr:tetratricopeptide repeat protein [Scytonematopsis contorta HA4267-MV1]
MSINDTRHPDNSARNRQVYHRLKQALTLGLRRQIFIAVCDDLNLRNKLVRHLHETLAYPLGQVLHQSNDVPFDSTPAYPRLVTLRLNLSDPNPIAQINQWLSNYPPPKVARVKDAPPRPLPIPSFQIVGAEQLTKQPVAVQRLFLHYLRLTEQHLNKAESDRFLDSSLLIWVPRPWLHAIQQSAPQFWRSRTGVFIFAGEPTPTAQTKTSPESFSGNRGFAPGNIDSNIDGSLDQSIFDEVVTPRELAEVETTGDFKFVVEDFDFQTEGKGNFPPIQSETSTSKSELVKNQPTTDEPNNRSNRLETKSLPSLQHVNKELTELVLETINTAISTGAIENQEAQQILLEIEKLHAQAAESEYIGAAYQKLGNFYRLQIESGQATLENLMVAILAYQEAIAHNEISPDVPDILNDLGTLYWMLYRTPPNSEEGQSYIEQGISFYQLALKLISPETNSETYARVQNNLGTAYGDLARFGDPAENWQQAVVAYSETLRFRTAQMDAIKYAATQNNLGTAYWHLAQHSQPVVHLKKAIAAYKFALVHYVPSQEPLKYGMIQNNIGTAYWNLAQHENGEENLLLAIEVYNEALKYRTAANAPTACAATQNNLGTAYWHLANLPQTTKELRQKYLKLCMEAYDEALALAHSLTSTTLSFDVFATHNNLGLAHYQLGTDQYFLVDKKVRSQHLEKALDNHLQALNGVATQTEAYQNTFNYLVKTVRAFHSELGIQGQNLALSKLPGYLLPDILPKL